MPDKHIVYHIPVCPFSQRLEILLALRGQQDAVEFRVVDITKPRDPALLEKTQGSTALPVLETPQGAIIKESLVILRFLDEVLDGPPPRPRRGGPAPAPPLSALAPLVSCIVRLAVVPRRATGRPSRSASSAGPAPTRMAI